MEPPAKRSKRIQQRKSSQTNETNSPSLLDQIRGCIREEMPAIVRAVVQEVTLPSSRPATSASTSSQNEPEIQTSNTPGADSATQATFPRPADMAIGSILDQSPGTCNSSNSISRPLGALVDQKIKAKIWADEYIELNSIIHKEQHDQFQMVERDGVMVFIKAKVGGNKFSSLAQWNNAFHIFVSVYCEKKPDSATSLMKYANIVNKLADQAGKPEVTLTGVRAEISVRVVGIGNGKYRCSYIPVVPGAYLLHITWNGRQLRGSPYKVNVIGAFYPNKVQVSGEGLRGGILGRSMEVFIDTRKAGPGELTAYCMGPNKAAYCELIDNKDGTFVLRIKPLEVGRHVLQVKYGGEHVNGSPFVLKVAAQPDASKVRVTGPGVEHGILATYQSRFIVETRGAGAGQLTVRIRGPKGGFQVEMYRDSQKDRTILCRYDPTETGLYIISIKWSGVDVPGSPFQVNIVDTQQELEQVLQESFSHSSVSQRSYSQWRQEI